MQVSNHNRGFTIIDAMIAAALFIITVTSIVRVMSVASTQLSHQKKMTQGINISEGVIEEMLLAYSDSSSVLTAGHHGPYCYTLSGVVASCPAGIFSTSWDVVNDIPLVGMMQINVKTSWKERGRQHSVKFVTYRD